MLSKLYKIIRTSTISYLSKLKRPAVKTPLGLILILASITTAHGNNLNSLSAKPLVDNTPPVANCKDFILQLDSNGLAILVPADIDDGSSDSSGFVTLSLNKTSFSCSELGNHSITLTVTDSSGNQSTCTATVIVEDNIGPMVNTKDITVYLDALGEATLSPADIDNGAFDSCGIASYSLDNSQFNCESIKNNCAPFQKNLFWSTFQGGEIIKADSYGSNQEVILNLDEGHWPTGLAYDGTTDKIYWARNWQGTLDTAFPCVYSANADGSNITPLTSDHLDIRDLALDVVNQVLFYSDLNDGIYRMNTDGTGKTRLRAEQGIRGLFYDSQNRHLYYPSNLNGGEIIRMNADGTNPVVVVHNIYTADIHYVASSESLYFSDFGTHVPTLFKKIGTNPPFIISSHGVHGGTYSLFVDEVAGRITFQTAGNHFVSMSNLDLSNNHTIYNSIYGGNLKKITAGQCASNLTTLTVMDVNGNTASSRAQVLVLDTVSPNTICNNITVALDTNGKASISPTDIDAGTTDACGIDTLFISQSEFNCSQLGQNTVTLTAIDIYGNSSTCNSVVTVVDLTPPSVLCKNLTIVLDSNKNATISAAEIDNGSSDICGIASMAASKTTFDCSHVGNNSVFLIVTDNGGNMDSCEAIITVEDNIAPVALAKDFTIQLGAHGLAILSPADVDNNSSDGCGIDNMIVTPNNFKCSNIGINTVTLTVTDVNGNSSTCTSNVFVEDHLAPAISCMNDTLILDSNGLVTVTASDLLTSYSDNCSAVSLTISKGTFGISDVGSNQVLITATDAYGNSSNCTSSVYVVEPKPNAVCKDTSLVLDSSGIVDILAVAIDNGSNSLVGISSFEVIPSQLDCSHAGTNEVLLVVTNSFGKTDTCRSNVTIIDQTPPTALAHHITLQLDHSGYASLAFADVDAGSFDVCGISSKSVSPNSFACADVGDNTVTLTVTDNNGNVSTTTSIVKVEDNELPVINNVPADIFVCGEQTVTWIEPTATDNCLVSFTADHVNGATYPVGVTTVTYTANDAGGNLVSASFNITVGSLPNISITQNQVPDFCQGLVELSSVIHNNADLAAPVSYSWDNGASTDDKYIVSSNGTYTLTVTDANGCNSTTNHVVNEDPTAAISAYLILAEKEINLNESSVNGSLGVTGSKKKVKVTKGSVVTGFVKSKKIDIKDNSTIGQAIYTEATPVLMPFYSFDNSCDGDKVKVDKNSTMTISGEAYGKIEVEKGATLFIDAQEVHMKELIIEENGSVIFLQSTNVMVEGNFQVNKNGIVDNGGNGVTFYLGKDLSIEEGVNFTANVYAKKGIQVEGNKNNGSLMTGLFISDDKVNSKENVTWNVSGICAPAPSPNGIQICPADFSREIAPEVTAVLRGEFEVIVYPNPTSNEFKLQISTSFSEQTNLIITDLIGKVVLKKENLNVAEVVTVGRNLQAGVYLIAVTQGNQKQVIRVEKLD